LQVLAWSCLLSGAAAQDGPTRAGSIPPTPILVSRVEPFRKLLAADRTERERLLALRPVPQREQFRKALNDYDSLTSDERERRLEALELRFQLTYLIPLGTEARTQALARLPSAQQTLVRERLDYWNQLSAEVQQTLLKNERLMRDFISRIASAQRPPLPRGAQNSNALGQIHQAVSSWNSLSESKRAAAEQAFRRMFELGSTEPAAGIFPQTDLGDMNRVLERFKHLSPAGKSLCLRSLSELLKMSNEELQIFLRSAEEWQKISPSDREAWKNLVKKSPVLPPYPPGFLKPRVLPASPQSTFATNDPRSQ
jgi:hypothetical protein